MVDGKRDIGRIFVNDQKGCSNNISDSDDMYLGILFYFISSLLPIPTFKRYSFLTITLIRYSMVDITIFTNGRVSQ